ncbi:hypothetical protein ACVWW4_006975 [Bradyrhizobium sp. LB7.1]
MVIEGESVRPWLTSRKALVPAALYLVFSLVIALSWRIKPLEALIPQGLTKLAYPLDKSNLDPLRLLHFLALAVVAVWFVPPNRQALTTPAMRGAILCGKHSLPIFCLGVLLTLASLLALLDVSEGLAMQITLSVGGILMMIVAADDAELGQDHAQAAADRCTACGRARPAGPWGTVDWRPLEAFRRGLREFGWAGGQNPVIDCRFANRQTHWVFRVADNASSPHGEVANAREPLSRAAHGLAELTAQHT